jgi:hypothetical protein
MFHHIKPLVPDSSLTVKALPVGIKIKKDPALFPGLNSGGRIRTSDLRVMGATSSFFISPDFTVSYEFTRVYQFFKEINMLHMLITNWLHFGYSDIILQGKYF